MQLGKLSYAARKEPVDYWKSIMKEQPIPEALKNLLHLHYRQSDYQKNGNLFVKDFDMKPSAIIYHTHSHSDPTARKHRQTDPTATLE